MKLNGNLVLNALGTSEIQNAFLERLDTTPSFNASDEGRLIYNTTTSLYYYNDGSAWVPFATGGNAALLQTEVDNIEAALGAGVNSNGQFQSGAFSTGSIIDDATSFTDALLQLDAASAGHDTLGELEDVDLGTLTGGEFLQYNNGTSKWEEHVLVLADVSDVTASAAEVNILDGATLSTTELNYVDGVTSPIQTQLDNKQPLDATLTALAAFNTNGIVVQTAADTFAGRTLTAPAAGITITNPAGIAGNPTFALANDLAALEGLATSGFIVRTGDGTATTREITGTAGRIVVSDGDGIASDANIDLETVADSGSGSFLKVSVDGYGRVTGTQAVVAGDITALVDATYVNAAGDSMTGNLNMGNNKVTGLAPGTAGTDAVNKNQLDALYAGLSWKQAVRAATTATVDLSTDLEATDVIDGVTLVAGDRVLVKDQAAPEENGIYIVQASGAAVRSVDLDDASDFAAATVFVTEGTVNADSGWTQTAEITTVDTDAVNFVQFTGSGTYMAGTGLALSGNTFNVNLGAGIVELPTDEVGIDLHDAATGAIILTTTGTNRTTVTGAKLHLLIPAGAGITQDATGLYIPADGVTNAMLANDNVGLNADSGTSTLTLGQTLLVAGDSVQGINSSVSGQTVTITAANASSSQKGVASFDSGDFTVTAGNVVIATAGIDNAQLANSTITVAGTSGSDAVALGETLTVVGGAGGETSTAVTANQIAISVRDATVSLKGVASFDAADFSVTAGAVSLVDKDLDSLTDVTITTPAAGQTLVYDSTVDGGDFVNKKIYFLYSGSSSTVHTVTHNIGQQYCNVTVVDATDEVIIPESISFTDENELEVTFTSAIACKVVVMGVPVA